ncbi:MAG: DUF4332 domain-containing protein [Anaerolineae bacterium]
MPIPLSRLKGVTPGLATRFKEVGLTTTRQLLAAGGTPESREMLAAQVGVGSELILTLVKRADLLRVQGIGDVYVELLEQTGVDSTAKLAACHPGSLYADIIKVNIAKKLTRRPPTLTKIRGWVTQAEQLS